MTISRCFARTAIVEKVASNNSGVLKVAVKFLRPFYFFPNFICIFVHMGKVVIITEQQEKFLREQKGLLFEYFSQVSNPKLDSDLLGNIQVWVYGSDRQAMTPHCHVMLADRSIEFEVSLIDWHIVNEKRGSATVKMLKKFNEWLVSRSTRIPGGKSNKYALFVAWDANNPNNDLEDYINKHGIEVKDDVLTDYLNRNNEDTK